MALLVSLFLALQAGSCFFLAMRSSVQQVGGSRLLSMGLAVLYGTFTVAAVLNLRRTLG